MNGRTITMDNLGSGNVWEEIAHGRTPVLVFVSEQVERDRLHVCDSKTGRHHAGGILQISFGFGRGVLLDGRRSSLKVPRMYPDIFAISMKTISAGMTRSAGPSNG